MTLTMMELEKMRSVDIGAVDKTTLTDARAIVLDPALPKAERIARFFEQVKNPYCFLFGDQIVKLEFAEDGPALQDTLIDFLIRQKSGL